MTLASKITLARVVFIPVYMVLMDLSGGQSGLFIPGDVGVDGRVLFLGDAGEFLYKLGG